MYKVIHFFSEHLSVYNMYKYIQENINIDMIRDIFVACIVVMFFTTMNMIMLFGVLKKIHHFFLKCSSPNQKIVAFFMKTSFESAFIFILILCKVKSLKGFY